MSFLPPWSGASASDLWSWGWSSRQLGAKQVRSDSDAFEVIMLGHFGIFWNILGHFVSRVYKAPYTTSVMQALNLLSLSTLCIKAASFKKLTDQRMDQPTKLDKVNHWVTLSRLKIFIYSYIWQRFERVSMWLQCSLPQQQNNSLRWLVDSNLFRAI